MIARIDMGWRQWRVGVRVRRRATLDDADPRQRSHDAFDRAAELDRLGWLIVRISHDMLANRPGVVIDRVGGALRVRGAFR